jgi:pyruvate formate lyase activating enzyme
MIIGGFLKQSLIDFPGKIASVIFTSGCNFRCFYCHNPELVLPELIQEDQIINENEIFAYLEKNKQLLDAVVITGGEPTIQPDLVQFILKVKDLGLLVKLDTNGTNPIVVKELLKNDLVDYIAMDIKSSLDQIKYSEIVGNQFTILQLESIKQTIQIIKESKIGFEFRTTLVKPYHTIKEIQDMATALSGDYYLQEYNDSKILDSTTDHVTSFSRNDFEKIIVSDSVNFKYR